MSLLAIAVSGCISATDGGDVAETGDLEIETATLRLGDEVVADTEPLLWKGRELATNQVERIDFEVSLPADYWTTHDGALEVSIAWDHRDYYIWFWLEVYSEDGTLLAVGEDGWLAQVVLLPEAPAGNYYALVTQYDGMGNYDGVIQLETREATETSARDLLPNIVTLPPTELGVYVMNYQCLVLLCVPAPSTPADAPGCDPVERVENGPEKCLRFTNRIGNAGEGIFHIMLGPTEAAQSMAGQGHWVQRIYKADGSFHDVPVGEAAFHLTHGHHHYQGMASFQIYEYDLETRTRGEAAGEGRKTGFYFVDSGLVGLGLPGTAPPYTCDSMMSYDMTEDAAGSCMSPNWFDLYYWSTPDQYVDLTGVPDGVYELVSGSNMVGSVIEADADDNEASVIFELTGTEVREIPLD